MVALTFGSPRRFHLLRAGRRNAPLAQSAEQLTLNQWVLGSSPRGCTTEKAPACRPGLSLCIGSRPDGRVARAVRLASRYGDVACGCGTVGVGRWRRGRCCRRGRARCTLVRAGRSGHGHRDRAARRAVDPPRSGSSRLVGRRRAVARQRGQGRAWHPAFVRQKHTIPGGPPGDARDGRHRERSDGDRVLANSAGQAASPMRTASASSATSASCASMRRSARRPARMTPAEISTETAAK